MMADRQELAVAQKIDVDEELSRLPRTFMN